MKLSIRGMALAMAMLWALCALVMGTANMIWPGYAGAFLDLLDTIYPGYQHTSTPASVAVLIGYAAVDGLIGGALLALFYNLASCCCCCCPKTQPDKLA